jgi:hypothetical protein
MSAPGFYLKLASWNTDLTTKDWTMAIMFSFMIALEPQKAERATIGRSRTNTVCLLFDRLASRFSCKIDENMTFKLCTEENDNKPEKNETLVFSKTNFFTKDEIRRGITLQEGKDITSIRAMYDDLKRSDTNSIETLWPEVHRDVGV